MQLNPSADIIPAFSLTFIRSSWPSPLKSILVTGETALWIIFRDKPGVENIVTVIYAEKAILINDEKISQRLVIIQSISKDLKVIGCGKNWFTKY